MRRAPSGRPRPLEGGPHGHEEGNHAPAAEGGELERGRSVPRLQQGDGREVRREDGGGAHRRREAGVDDGRGGLGPLRRRPVKARRRVPRARLRARLRPAREGAEDDARAAVGALPRL